MAPKNYIDSVFLSADNFSNYSEFIDKKSNDLVIDSRIKSFLSNPLEITSYLVSGKNFIGSGGETSYTSQDNLKESMIFNLSQTTRLIDIEKELLDYEGRYKMKSSIFYENWKSKPGFDNSDFNKWANLYRIIKYAQE